MEISLNIKLLKLLLEIVNTIWNTKYTPDDIKVLSIEPKRFDIKTTNGHGYSVSYSLLLEYDVDFNAELN